MSLSKILGTILKTIDDVQKKNKKNPKEETANKTIFSMLKSKIRELDEKTKEQRVAKGKSPESILDLIKKEIEGVKKLNKNDPNQKTAPKSIFDSILKKVEAPRQRQASTGLKKIVLDYNLDTTNVPQDAMDKVQKEYVKQRKKFDNEIARSLNKIIKSYNK